VTDGFDLASYQLELEQAAFESARARLEGQGWTLEPGPPDHVRARKVFDGPHEIVLPLDRIERAVDEYDDAQSLRAAIAAVQVRDAEVIEKQRELDAELKRNIRAVETRLRDEAALRDHP
jgi:hypothetical protein